MGSALNRHIAGKNSRCREWHGWVVIAGMTARQRIWVASPRQGWVPSRVRRHASQAARSVCCHQLIYPAVDDGLSTKARGRVVRDIATREHTNPFGTRVRYTRETLTTGSAATAAAGRLPDPRTVFDGAAHRQCDVGVRGLAQAGESAPLPRWPGCCGFRGGGPVGVDTAAPPSPVQVDRSSCGASRRCSAGSKVEPQ